MDSPGSGQAEQARSTASLSSWSHCGRYLCRADSSASQQNVGWQEQHQIHGREAQLDKVKVNKLNEKHWQKDRAFRLQNGPSMSPEEGVNLGRTLNPRDKQIRNEGRETMLGNKNTDNISQSGASLSSKTGRCCGNARRSDLVSSVECEPVRRELNRARQRGAGCEMANTLAMAKSSPVAAVTGTKVTVASLLCKQTCPARPVVKGCISQQQLDSCSSSDSGQGSNSLVTTASSLASVRITNSSSCGSSVSSCCSSSSSAASRWSSSSLGALECRSHSCGATSASLQSQTNRCAGAKAHQAGSQDVQLVGESSKFAGQASADRLGLESGTGKSAERRRLSWLVSLGATGAGVQAMVLKSDAQEPPRGVSEAKTDLSSAASHYRLVHSSSASVSAGACSQDGCGPPDAASPSRLSPKQHGQPSAAKADQQSRLASRANQRLVVGGKVERVEFFPSENTGGKLIVFLDVDGLQKAQLIDSDLVQVVGPSSQIMAARKTASANSSFEASNMATLIIEPPEHSSASTPSGRFGPGSSSSSSEQLATAELAVSLSSTSSSTSNSQASTSSSDPNLASLVNLINSDASGSDFDEDDHDDREQPGQDNYARNSARFRTCKERSQFWQLVASETSSSSNSDASSPLPVNSMANACPLVKLIQAADEDPVNRPRLLFLNGHSDDFATGATQTANEPRELVSSSELDDEELEGSGYTRHAFPAPATPSPSVAGLKPAARLNSIDEEQNNPAGCLTGSQSDISETVDLDAHVVGEPSATGSEEDDAHVDLLHDGNRDNRKHHLGGLLCDSSGSSGSDQDDDDYFYDDEMLDAPRQQSSPAGRARALPFLSNIQASSPDCTRLGASRQQQHQQRQQQTDNNNCNTIDNDEPDNPPARQRQREATNNKPAHPMSPLSSNGSVLHSLAASKQQPSSSSSSSTTSTDPLRDTKATSNCPGETTSGTHVALEPEATNLLARLQAEHSPGARPLIVWAPSARRVSCPVGQLASFSSWRQLWPPERDLQSALSSAMSQLQSNANPSQAEQMVPVCPTCLTQYQQNNQPQQAAGPRLAASSQQQSNLRRSMRPPSPASDCLSSSRKTSRLSLTCSDYFSSFDQSNSAADQTSTCQNASLLSLSSQFSQQQAGNSNQQDLSSLRDVLAIATRSSGCRGAATNLAASHLQPSCRRARCFLGPVSSQSQRVGLPTAGELRRQSTITGFDHQKYQAPRSPSLCLPGVRRPPSVQGSSGRGPGVTSPNTLLSANLQHRAQLLVSPTHSTGGSSSPSPTNWVGSAGQGSNQLAYQSAGHRLPGQAAGAMRNRLESLESDRGSSPSWTASTSSLRSSIGGVSSCAALCYPSLARLGAGSSVRSKSKVVTGIEAKQAAHPTTLAKLGTIQASSNNQHVYFFLCCCQRRRSPSGEPESRGAQQADQAVANRRPLVGREATVGGSQVHQQQRHQQQETEVTPAVDAGGGSNAPRGTRPDNGADVSGLASSCANTCTASTVSQWVDSSQQTNEAPSDPTKEEQPDRDQIGLELAKLLETLDKLKAASRDRTEPAAQCLGHAQLIGRIRARLNDCEQLILGAAVQSGAQAASQLATSSSAGRANLMRYSTPNLLLSSNFEHILRERGDKANYPADQLHTGPPEALEAWFLSQTLAGGRSPTSGGALRRPMQCLGSRESIRRASGSAKLAGVGTSERQTPQDERRDEPSQGGSAIGQEQSLGSHSAWQTGDTTADPRQASSACQSETPTTNLVASAEKYPRASNPIISSREPTSLPGSALPVPPSLIQDNKSIQQARYLYSTLTCNASALLASSHSAVVGSQRASSPGAAATGPSSCSSSSAGPGSQAASSGAAQSRDLEPKVGVSPSRATHMVQRKQAQFVDRQQRKAQAEREQKRLCQLQLSSPGSSSSVLTSDQPSVETGTRLGSGQRQSTSNEPYPSSSSSDSSDSESNAHSSPSIDTTAWKRRLDATKGKASARLGLSKDEDSLSVEDLEVAQTPAIVETQHEHVGALRRQSHGSQTSRSSSVNIEMSGQAVRQQLQPVSMDPAMHALWAQGADLDTGNGNFIMATRRRRSVHVVHQVQLAHIQQQQQQQHQHQQQQQLQQQPQVTKCFKIEEQTAAPAPTSTSDLQAASGSRSLRNELRKLRAACSIDEVPPSAPPTGKTSSMCSQARQSTLDPIQATPKTDTAQDRWAPAAPGEQPGVLQSETADSVAANLAKRERKQIAVQIMTGARGADEDHNSQTSDCDEDNKRFYQLADTGYDLDDLESSSTLLANLYDWNYPIFELAHQYGDSILSKLSYRIFFDSGFFDSFKIPKLAFFNFFHALEEGYHHKPYHNRLHAADVLHAVYYLTSQPIDNFCQVPLDLIEHYDNLLATTKRPRLAAEVASSDSFNLHNHIVAVVVAAAAAAADSELPFGIMGANLTALEVMALYTAAAMHDFQHPGRTNSFLVATNSPLALLYNDRSVLENHHSAAAWALFYSGPNYNWLCNLEKDEFKRFRFMIIELILATDLMRHYELVSAFNKKLNNTGRHNIDWFCESDRLLVMEIIIKLADVNGPMKGHQLHCQWTDRIAMEFYEQGDEERALNLPVSLYMDRSDPRLPELQKSFINHLVGPLSHSYAAAGFFPKSTEPFGLSQPGNKSQDNNNGQANKELTITNNNDNELDDNNHRHGALRTAKDECRSDQIAQGSRSPDSTAKEKELSSGCSSSSVDHPLADANEGAEKDELEVDSVYNQSKYWLIDHSKTSKLNKQFLRCTQTSNLRNNFLYWDAKSKEKQTPTSANQSLDIIEGDQPDSIKLIKETKSDESSTKAT